MISPKELISWLDERLDLAVQGIERASECGDRERVQYWMGQCNMLEQVKMIVMKLENHA